MNQDDFNKQVIATLKDLMRLINNIQECDKAQNKAIKNIVDAMNAMNQDKFQ